MGSATKFPQGQLRTKEDKERQLEIEKKINKKLKKKLKKKKVS